MVGKLEFKDFDKNVFAVTIGRVQALALEKAKCKVPTPAEQLALVKARRDKKRKPVA